LTHAVRNSVDHGIEPPEDRLKAGKPAEGLVRLRAFHHGGSVVIEVTDDGAGISVERVLAKAVERGLVTAEQAGSMSEREALQMVFVAGFSTAAKVTHISGRGVGMDVVRANVEKVGGSVELESRMGLGTTVEAAVERIGTVELYRLRELLLPLVWLDSLLGLERSADAAHGIYIAVVESEGCRFGLVVDDLMAPEEIVVKPLSAVLREIGVFSGATVLGSGKLAMILDVAAIGARAGVRPAEARMVTIADANAENLRPKLAQALEMESAMVIYELHEGERMAMPLSGVERIETVALSAIEFAGGRAMLQYRGELLPLEDEGNVLAAMEAAASLSETHVSEARPFDGLRAGYGAPEVVAGEVTMLICLRVGAHGVKHVGVIVRRVLDVSNGTLLAADEAASAGQLAMVKDRVITVHREPQPWKPMLKEVA
jgi:two-component system, chemotaxis family, sensor kinase CheA